MAIDKMLLSGSSGLLIMTLLADGDMYGYEITAELARRSDDTFALKAGTLYPLLHSLEGKGYIRSYDKTAEETGKRRRYYTLTPRGQKALADKNEEWKRYTDAVDKVLRGGLT